jgi:hypothetical protein
LDTLGAADRRQQRRRRAGAGAEAPGHQATGGIRVGEPIDRHHTLGKQRDVEAKLPRPHVCRLLFGRQQVEQERAEPHLVEALGDLAVAWALAPTACTVREGDDGRPATRHPQVAVEPDATGGDPYRVDRGSASHRWPTTHAPFWSPRSCDGLITLPLPGY